MNIIILLYVMKFPTLEQIKKNLKNELIKRKNNTDEDEYLVLIIKILSLYDIFHYNITIKLIRELMKKNKVDEMIIKEYGIQLLTFNEMQCVYYVLHWFWNDKPKVKKHEMIKLVSILWSGINGWID